ncbi:MAG: glycyl-radical enzyme activating protein [Planctomycetaceae bacterium]|nr:glycyl-radical enzyme activating protein [Planctomycetaceae bacterium]
MKSSVEPKSARGTDATALLEKVMPVPHAETEISEGMVLRIERSSIHDGDGFRTVVFLKGCPLRCQWCSTPESMSPAVEHVGTQTYGTVMSVEEVMTEVRKDGIFFFHSGGGMTLSGGEPLAQAGFAAALLRQSQYEAINTAIETGLAVPFRQVEKVIPYLDAVYADLKHIDEDKHRYYCGMDNAIVLDNLRRLDGMAKGIKLVVRMPLVPGINDDNETLHRTGTFLATLDNLHSAQILPYHRLGIDTYRKLGREYLLQAVVTPDPAHVEAAREILRNHVSTVC